MRNCKNSTITWANFWWMMNIKISNTYFKLPFQARILRTARLWNIDSMDLIARWTPMPPELQLLTNLPDNYCMLNIPIGKLFPAVFFYPKNSWNMQFSINFRWILINFWLIFIIFQLIFINFRSISTCPTIIACWTSQ